MTARKYASETNVDILASERPEIIERLKRVVEAQKPRLTPSRPIR